tara:strand:+ start:3122 stop:3682 length:561 start_codon:yes stop_codon:yes gene_type:complete
MQSDHLSKYIFLSMLIHAIFLFSIKTSVIKHDVSQIGEQGMQIQMVLIQDDSIDKKEPESLLSEKKKVIKDEKKEQQAIVDNRLQGDRAKKIYQSYFGVIRNILDSNKKYPLLALQRRQEGSPIVEFTILKNGEITNFNLITSGHRLLDREAKKIVLKSVPFPPIPASMGKSTINLRIPINFNLQY